ncbi:MAG: flippase-like domain-containing protein [Cytophagales bacterium]|nr:flippase-like domain-containing protein [Cytophagales bacterium]
MESKTKNFLKTVLKFVVSGGALYIVFRNIDWDETRLILLSVNIEWLITACLFFIASKVVSSYRLNIYFKVIDLAISQRYNLRLYWVGMFYNLFLPGGIGGDGFKVYLLNKKFETKVKSLIQASLLDRVSGLAALLFLAGIGYFFINSELPDWVYYANAIALFLLIPIYSFVINRFFNVFHSSFWVTNFYSIGVQWLQVLSAYFILLSLGVSDLYLEYLVLFLISSVVAVFPFTIGGVGARELTFILGYQYVGIDENVAVAFSLLFFLITAFVSMFGGFVKVRHAAS